MVFLDFSTAWLNTYNSGYTHIFHTNEKYIHNYNITCIHNHVELERIETCQAGASSVIVVINLHIATGVQWILYGISLCLQPDGNSYAFGVGAPSYDKWKGMCTTAMCSALSL